MINRSLIILGKAISRTSKLLNRGNGSTWPGHIALNANPHFIKDFLKQTQTKIIIVAGTNGKTTTASLIKTGLEKNGKKVIQNTSGANLLNGIASTLILNSNQTGKINADYAIFEVDENALHQVLKQVAPDYLILLNLFRDQLDRYGEINTITKKWQKAINQLPEKTKLILNADDPQIAYLGLANFTANGMKQSPTVSYFSLENKKNKHQTQQAADSISCPRCGAPLEFASITFSHLGDWYCKKCKLKHPSVAQLDFQNYPLAGIYNKYNTNAAILVLKHIGLTDKQIADAFSTFKPAFGRQEIVTYKNKQIQLFLSKNPTSFNQSYTTIKDLKATTLLLVLNDRIPDGRDVSWIWDIDLTGIDQFKHIIISGDRTYDMALRIQYEQDSKWTMENEKWKIEPDLQKAINYALEQTSPDQTLYILPTYSAMLDVRKIITGKKIL